MQKTVTNKSTNAAVTTDYIVSGSQILAETINGNTIWYHIDGKGHNIGFEYQGVNYYYMYNAQGDVVGITDKTGAVLGVYRYDAWGKLISVKAGFSSTSADITDPTNIALINPIRYRGYYYDTETGLFYVGSRYYDPGTGRFVNADGILGVNNDMSTYNLFAYCSNNPVNRFDPSGFKAYSMGITANATALLGISLSIGISWDDKGNWGFQFSHAQPTENNGSYGILDAGAGIFFGEYWSADTIYDLEGGGTQVGASAGASWYAGGDAIWLEDGDSEYDGFQFNIGYGAGVDVHANFTQTERTFGGNSDKRYPKGATNEDLATAEYFGGGWGWVIRDTSGKGFGWIDGIYYSRVD